jgi:predicted O-methyltransferase YrrM
MKNLVGLKFIGDLSLEDADILVKYGKLSRSILEFGVGGSTQILSQCRPDKLITVDTDSNWIDLTKSRLDQIQDRSECVFYMYNEYPNMIADQMFDMIFVDGITHLRRDFAINTWKNLSVGGVMVFHDTRRPGDFKNAALVAQQYSNEVSLIEVNAAAENGMSSNITVIHKKAYQPYVNWNFVEGKPGWLYDSKNKDQPLWQFTP